MPETIQTREVNSEIGAPSGARTRTHGAEDFPFLVGKSLGEKPLTVGGKPGDPRKYHGGV